MLLFLSAAAVLFTAPITLPILERYKNYRQKQRAQKAIKAILQDAFDDKDTLAKWTHHDMTYVILDGAAYSTRHDVLKQIKEHDGKWSISWIRSRCVCITFMGFRPTAINISEFTTCTTPNYTKTTKTTWQEIHY